MSDEILTPELAKGFNPYSRDPLHFEPPYPTRFSRARLAFKYAIQALIPRILIVDLSHWNGLIDVEAMIRSGVVAVIIKCSEGTTFKDPKFEEVWRAFHAAGIPIMLYHFFRGEKGAEEQDWFMTCADSFLQEVNGKTAVWLDCEWKPDGQSLLTYSNRAFRFCYDSQSEGLKAGIYSSSYYVGKLFPADEARWGTVFQWNAHWTGAQEDTLPAGWSEALRMVWQFAIYPVHSWAVTVSGSQGSLDENWGFWESADALRSWMGAITEPIPGDHEHKDLQDQIDALKLDIAILFASDQDQDLAISENASLISKNWASIKVTIDEIATNRVALNNLVEVVRLQDLKDSEIEQIALANGISVEKLKSDLQKASDSLDQGGGL